MLRMDFFRNMYTDRIRMLNCKRHCFFLQQTYVREKMGPNRTGFTPLAVTSLVVGGMAIITHITAVAYPQWDGIDVQWRPVPDAPIALPIQAHSSLWDFNVVTDKSRKFFSPLQHYRDTGKY